MSELKELKVGDVVSVWDSVFGEWTAERITKLHAENEFETVSSFLYSHDYSVLWQHGIHESLIPEGYAIVESSKLKFEYDRNLELSSKIAELNGQISLLKRESETRRTVDDSC